MGTIEEELEDVEGDGPVLGLKEGDEPPVVVAKGIKVGNSVGPDGADDGSILDPGTDDVDGIEGWPEGWPVGDVGDAVGAPVNDVG